MGYRRKAEALNDRMRRVRRVLWVILALNIGVALAKLLYGLWSRSVAMQADGFHSMFDGTSNIVGLVGTAMALRPVDRDHPYGHAKYETYASAIIGAMLVVAAWNIGSAAVRHLIGGDAEAARVGIGSFVVMLSTLAINIFVTMWERRVGTKLGSEILVADASHTGSDVLVSLGVIGGLIAVKAGFEWADPVIALAVSVAIAYTAWQVFQQANVSLSDTARIPTEEIRLVVEAVPGVLGCHSVRTRGTTFEVYVDLHIQVDPSANINEGHEIAEAVEQAVCAAFPQAADIIAHLEPMDEYQARKTAGERDAGLV
jgi:cation diffusion facilitator family transporter